MVSTTTSIDFPFVHQILPHYEFSIEKAVVSIGSDHIGLLHLHNGENGRNKAEDAANDRKCKRPVEITSCVFCAINDDADQHEHHYKQRSN